MKEEPKQDLRKYPLTPDECFKQERTDDEILEAFRKAPLVFVPYEQKYSEEDMKLAFETGRNFQLTGENNFNELIEQFKKK
jgi:hypothetical protein